MTQLIKTYLIPALALMAAFALQTCSSADPVVVQRLRAVESVMTGADIRFRSTALKLIERGADSTFLSMVLHHPRTNFVEKMLKINVTGFLTKADYSHNLSTQSLTKAREFYRLNSEFLRRIESSSGVPANVVTSILWIETKFGTVTGKNHVLSVYASLAAADDYSNIEMNKQTYRTSTLSKDSLDKLDSLVEARAHKKAAWAVDQLLALQKINSRGAIDVTELQGSWAGAFGWSQFIPSSYLSWAVDGNADGKIDLFCKEDAIASIANYLKSNGWTDERSKQVAAVYHYNNSNDYVNCVLTLAEKIGDKL